MGSLNLISILGINSPGCKAKFRTPIQLSFVGDLSKCNNPNPQGRYLVSEDPFNEIDETVTINATKTHDFIAKFWVNMISVTALNLLLIKKYLFLCAFFYIILQQEDKRMIIIIIFVNLHLQTSNTNYRKLP